MLQVLGGHKGLLHKFGDVIERHPDAPVARLEDVGKIRALGWRSCSAASGP